MQGKLLRKSSYFSIICSHIVIYSYWNKPQIRAWYIWQKSLPESTPENQLSILTTNRKGWMNAKFCKNSTSQAICNAEKYFLQQIGTKASKISYLALAWHPLSRLISRNPIVSLRALQKKSPDIAEVGTQSWEKCTYKDHSCKINKSKFPKL